MSKCSRTKSADQRRLVWGVGDQGAFVGGVAKQILLRWSKHHMITLIVQRQAFEYRVVLAKLR